MNPQVLEYLESEDSSLNQIGYQLVINTNDTREMANYLQHIRDKPKDFMVRYGRFIDAVTKAGLIIDFSDWTAVSISGITFGPKTNGGTV